MRRMTTSWEKGMEILTGLQDHYTNEPERLLDISVAKALGIQLHSAYNILDFYLLRENMFRMEGRERLDILNQLRQIIKEEIELDEQLLVLCEKDSRLGFHSEAEGYKYFPEKIRWRMSQLRSVLANDVPEVKRMIRNDEMLFPEYTGKRPAGSVADCIVSHAPVWSDKGFVLPADLKWESCNYGPEKTMVQWASAHIKNALYIIVSDKDTSDPGHKVSPIAGIEVKIEPQRLYPAKHFVFTADNKNDDPVHITGYPLLFRGGLREINDKGIWYGAVRIPLKEIGINAEQLNPVRMDVIVQRKGRGTISWRPNNPTTSRLILGTDNPADLGWLRFVNY